MIYNIHPLFVHFPIALLLLYSLLKILPLERWFPGVAWRQTQQIILLVGVLGAFASMTTGGMSEDLVRTDHDLLEMHEFFALISTWVYCALLFGEILYLLNMYITPKLQNKNFTKISQTLEKIITDRRLSIVLVIVGTIAISVTGLLGGVMVYGVTADPLAPFVLKLLGL